MNRPVLLCTQPGGQPWYRKMKTEEFDQLGTNGLGKKVLRELGDHGKQLRAISETSSAYLTQT